LILFVNIQKHIKVYVKSLCSAFQNTYKTDKDTTRIKLHDIINAFMQFQKIRKYINDEIYPIEMMSLIERERKTIKMILYLYI